MSITLAEVIRAVRARHGAFTKDRVPDRVLGDYLSDVQNELLATGARLDPTFCAQSLTIALALDGANTPAAVGAGTSGGLPAVETGGGVDLAPTTAGALAVSSSDVADGATVVLTDRLATSVTASTVTSTGAGRTTNEDAGRVLRVLAGPGLGQQREIASNTSDTWTLTADWTDGPVAGVSLIAVIADVLVATPTTSVVTALPATTTQTGYLVQLDASGQPYVDYTAPVVATVEQGVPLPAMTRLLPGLCQVWTRDGAVGALTVLAAADRRHALHGPTVYTIGTTLYLAGSAASWADVASIELRYTPLAGVFAATSDAFLLPDLAKPCLVAQAGAFAAMRVQGLDGVRLDPAPHAAEADRASQDFRRAVLSATRGRQPSRVAERW